MNKVYDKLINVEDSKINLGGFKSYKMISIFKDVIFSYDAETDIVSINKDNLRKNIDRGNYLIFN